MKRAKRVMVLPDLHVPFHDNAALDCALQAAGYWKPDEVVILGDWLDAAAFSTHGKSSLAEMRSESFLRTEIVPCNALIDCFDDRPVTFIAGNHEFRVERYAVSLQNPDIYKLLSPERLLRYRVNADGLQGEKRKQFKYIPYVEGSGLYAHHKITKDLIAVHGWSFAANFAQKHLDLARSYSVVCGHVHRCQQVTGRNPFTDKLMHSWSPGCLAGLHPQYMARSPNGWAHGFDMIYVGDGSWTHYTVSIEKGRCTLPDGKQIRAHKDFDLLEWSK